MICLKDLNLGHLKTITKNDGFTKGEKIKEKETILKYLKSFQPYAASSARIVDEDKNVEIDSICYLVYIDDLYCWSTADIYHFENYDIPLSEAFVDYILSK